MDELIPLSNRTLEDLKIERPRYDRSVLTPGIVHIGVGNFHRAHQAWYLHRLMQAGEALDWAVIGAGVRPYDAAMREKQRWCKLYCLGALVQSTRETHRWKIENQTWDCSKSKTTSTMHPIHTHQRLRGGKTRIGVEVFRKVVGVIDQCWRGGRALNFHIPPACSAVRMTGRFD